MQQKPTGEPIRNEARADVGNKRGTIAFARTNVVDSATAQFFINHVDNSYLDHIPNNPERYGYAVFGRVIAGLDIVDAIANVRTGTIQGNADAPQETITIISVRRIED